MDAPFFSIVIPCFNSDISIRQTIASILEQTCPDFEIVIVDGASTDSTLQVINEFNDLRIRIYSEPDKGVYDAMNKGMAMAMGKWLYFLGSDDYLFDTAVLNDVKLFIETTACSVLYGSVKVHGSSGWARDGEIYAFEFDYRKLLKKNICHQSIFYHRAFVRKNNFSFNLRYPVSADWDFNLKCWNKSKFIYLPRVIAVFRAGGLSTRKEVFEPFIAERKRYWTISIKLKNMLKVWLKRVRS